MDPVALAERLAKKRREAAALRGLSPGDRLEMGFQLMEFGRQLSEAGDRAAAKA